MIQPKRIYRFSITIILLGAVGLSSFIGFKAYASQQWETIASAMAVITAVFAIFSSISLTWSQLDKNEPILSFFIEKGPHKHAFEIVLRNDGGGPAYNVMIKWIRPLKDFRGIVVRFSEFENRYDFEFLPQNARFARFLLGSDYYIKLIKEAKEPLDYECIVSYSLSASSRFRKKQHFIVSLEPFRISLDVQSDQADFYFENKQLAKHVKKIADSLKNLDRVISSHKNQGSKNDFE